MELLYYPYYTIGFLIGIYIISSRIDSNSDESLAFIVGILMVFVWPIYVMYKLIKMLIKNDK